MDVRSPPALLAIVAVALAAACGGTSDDSRPTAEERAAQRADAAYERGERQQDRQDRRAARRVRRELRTYFSTAPWYDTIKRVATDGGDVTVTTTLNRVAFDGDPDQDAIGPATAICTTITGPGVTGGRVLGSDGGVIKRCGA